MTRWVNVNGARIEESFFEDNVREACNYEWTPISVSELKEHGHCMICGIALDPKTLSPLVIHTSAGGRLCDYCYTQFIA